MKARLILEDGTELTGKSFGAVRESYGEVIFNTAMTGYQEMLSDPTGCGQIVTMTYPLQGNYGINRDDFEAVRPYLHGIVAREHCEYPSNFRSQQTLDSLLKEYDIPGISEIDTRMLTRRIRDKGTMRGVITTKNTPVEEILETLRLRPAQTDQVSIVSTNRIYCSPGRGARIALIDYGVKHGILRELSNRHCDITVVPYNTPAKTIEQLRPDGIVLSNGPGNPKDVTQAVETVQQLMQTFPVFGIGLGHQLFALANGADTEKMKFGHHGANHAVKDVEQDRVMITAQSHGYTVTPASIENTDLIVTHLAVNDGTIEGLKHKTLPAFSVQYHPEASPGPEDSSYLFDHFLNIVVEYIKGVHPNATTR
ncbi:carbamoyl phosphate synthase small subunit [Ammoniphilus oxalaticus]|uniref:Carbamoyl phosphate synthase small chain n=1 Tax=Ammoniphilus oxalaticus TaxID=66863 RepID=A0A419SJA9_9BACL|nr:carbamoyl phosphate synthase small subunit [Ammoniphilus oxalaticus]RKD24121.1 carbamoyl phosphate synthase small subunit [Ammoniphilus oxalaticus]